MIVNGNSIVQHVIQIRNGIMINVKENHSWNPSTRFCENSKYLKSIDDNYVMKLQKLQMYQQM